MTFEIRFKVSFQSHDISISHGHTTFAHAHLHHHGRFRPIRHITMPFREGPYRSEGWIKTYQRCWVKTLRKVRYSNEINTIFFPSEKKKALGKKLPKPLPLPVTQASDD
ncbi:hypothetical protein TNCT_102111 [Trichonephila clavata]|uniref:Uncharacterized protein n=1 Tax=Trichonephila clavata TaxID=2740835 RepID=A0A8X6L535_TRICU|nr:hypothetical protein TNCT_102111 [Trichonephila clavata]